jgi:hypothetical protein
MGADVNTITGGVRSRFGIVALIGVALAILISTPALGATSRREPGMGSTSKAWKNAYGVSRGPGSVCSAKDSCFGPVVRNADSGRTYEFTDVDVTKGIISGYQQNFAKNTTLTEVETAIQRTLPTDALLGPVTIDTVGGSCGLINISSPTLLKELNTPKIGDTTGTVGIELQHITANLNSVYSTTNIQTATLTIVAFSPSESC